METVAPHATSVEHHVAHHFDSAEQQLAAGKLGMWIFLVTEVLFFSGLFVAYAVYRSLHPEVFVDAHYYLSTTLGGLNTIVLLFSSLTMAWAVRCAQLGQQRGLLWCLSITLACAGLFLGVKAVEYSTKWQEGLLWAGAYSPYLGEVSVFSTPLIVLSLPATAALVAAGIGLVIAKIRNFRPSMVLCTAVMAASLAFAIGIGIGLGVTQFESHGHRSHGKGTTTSAGTLAESGDVGNSDDTLSGGNSINFTGVFFSIYYAMTGVHALHILGGMGVIAWLILCAAKGRYGSQYFNPVDYVGLYWHLVDIVWIYLFPLLYLIR